MSCYTWVHLVTCLVVLDKHAYQALFCMAIPEKSCTHDFTSFIPNQLDQLTGFSLHLEYLATCQRQNCVWGTWNAFLLRVLTLDPPWSLLVAIQSLLRINCGPFHLLSLVFDNHSTGTNLFELQFKVCFSPVYLPQMDGTILLYHESKKAHLHYLTRNLNLLNEYLTGKYLILFSLRLPECLKMNVFVYPLAV